jgi:hypothetical protein
MQPQSAPGTCQVCGHPVPAYRIMDVSKNPIGVVEAAAGSPEALQAEAWLAGRAVQPDHIAVFSVHTCRESEDYSLWHEARSGKAAPQEPVRPRTEPKETEPLF